MAIHYPPLGTMFWVGGEAENTRTQSGRLDYYQLQR